VSLQLEVIELSRNDHAAWDQAVADSIGGSPYSCSAYLTALSNATGGEYRLLAVCDESRILGGIGLYIRAHGRREYVRGRYLLYYNGPFVRRISEASPIAMEETTHRVLTCIESRLRSTDYSRVQIRPRHTVSDCRPFLQQGWQAHPTFSYIVDISDIEACFSRMHRNVRRQIRQAERTGIQATRSDNIDGFFSLHQQTCQRKGFPTYLGRDSMIAFYDELRESNLARLYMVGEPDSPPSAGVLVLASDHPVTHTVCAASRSGKLPSGANTWLRWHVFKDLSECGYAENDLTDAHEPAVAKFKRQLGARLVVSQQLGLPPTINDHLRAAYGLAKRELKQILKRMLPLRGAE